MSQDGKITDEQLLGVFEVQNEANVEALAEEEVADHFRTILDTLWVDPDPDQEPGAQLQEELTGITEILETEEALRLVAGMQEVLGAYFAGTLPWTQSIADAFRESAEAIAEELNPEPPREKLHEAVARLQELFQTPEEAEAAGLPDNEVAEIFRELIDTLWAEPDPDQDPGAQLQEELNGITEILEDEGAQKLVRLMQDVLTAYSQGTFPWSPQVSEAFREGARAIAEELNPEPAREKLEEIEEHIATHTAGGGEVPVLILGSDAGSLQETLSPALADVAGEGESPQLAVGAPEALVTDGAEPLRLVLVDADTPGMEELGLVRDFRTRDAWTPMVVTAADPDTEFRRRAIAAGANKVVARQGSSAELARQLQDLWA